MDPGGAAVGRGWLVAEGRRVWRVRVAGRERVAIRRGCLITKGWLFAEHDWSRRDGGHEGRRSLVTEGRLFVEGGGSWRGG